MQKDCKNLYEKQKRYKEKNDVMGITFSKEIGHIIRKNAAAEGKTLRDFLTDAVKYYLGI